MDKPRVVGFFDVNRVSQFNGECLMRLGWMPVLGDPRQVVWPLGWRGRIARWLGLLNSENT